MIVKLQCTFGVPLNLALGNRFGPRVEAEALEFLNGAPIEWRLPPTDWQPGLHSGRMPAFHDLQKPVSGGTRGTSDAQAYLETRGIAKPQFSSGCAKGHSRKMQVAAKQHKRITSL